MPGEGPCAADPRTQVVDRRPVLARVFRIDSFKLHGTDRAASRHRQRSYLAAQCHCAPRGVLLTPPPPSIHSSLVAAEQNSKLWAYARLINTGAERVTAPRPHDQQAGGPGRALCYIPVKSVRYGLELKAGRQGLGGKRGRRSLAAHTAFSSAGLRPSKVPSRIMLSLH